MLYPGMVLKDALIFEIQTLFNFFPTELFPTKIQKSYTRRWMNYFTFKMRDIFYSHRNLIILYLINNMEYVERIVFLLKQCWNLTMPSHLKFTKIRFLIFCTVPFCTVSFFTVPFCTVPFCTVPFCTVPFCTVSFCTVPFCTVPFCTVPFCLVLPVYI